MDVVGRAWWQARGSIQLPCANEGEGPGCHFACQQLTGAGSVPLAGANAFTCFSLKFAVGESRRANEQAVKPVPPNAKPDRLQD